jgi:DUF1680 family protein
MERSSSRMQRYSIRVRGEGIRTLRLRRPSWAGEIQLLVDGEVRDLITDHREYLEICEDFGRERQVEVQWTPEFRLNRTPDVPELAAAQYGPYVLAVVSDQPDFIAVKLREGNVAEKMSFQKAEEDTLHFECEGWQWIPLYEIKNLSYHVYVRCVTEQ